MQFLFIPIGYLLGSIPFGWLAVKIWGKEDIRHSGSGATGATNVGRQLGLGKAALVGTLDMLKAFIPTLITVLIWPDAGWHLVLIMLSISIGHSKSLYLGFKGGRAASTTAGSMFALAIVEPNILIIAGVAIAVMVLMAIASDIMSVGTLSGIVAGAVVVGISLAIDLIPTYYGLGLLTLGAWVWLTHIENIKRLINGEEQKRRLNFIRKGG